MDRCVRILLGKSINDTATSDQVRLRLDARPISMSVRMASDRDTRSPPHLSIAAIVAAGTRNAITGSFAVVRRPRFETVDAPPRRVIFSTVTGLMRAWLKVWRGSIGPILDFPIGAPSVSKPAVKAISIQVGVDDRALYVTMPEVVLDRPGIPAIVGKLIASGMA